MNSREIMPEGNERKSGKNLGIPYPNLNSVNLKLDGFKTHDAPVLNELILSLGKDTFQLGPFFSIVTENPEYWILSQPSQWVLEKNLHVAVRTKEDEKLIGAVSIFQLGEEEKGHLGFWVGKNFWNQNFCTEAIQTLLPFLSNFGSLRILIAKVNPQNYPSRRVLEKCKFQMASNGEEDDVLYSLVINPPNY